jgi:hypothetical protein
MTEKEKAMNLKLKRSLFGATFAALAFQIVTSASAAPLVLDDVTARAAAAQLGAKYGVTIVIPSASARRVSLTIDDVDAPGTRLQAINTLANALGLDFTETYVVSRSADGHGIPATVDMASAIPFGKTTLSAREALDTLAGVSDARVEVARDVDGTVTLSSATLTPTQAAQEIAAQTGTTCHLVYTLARRSQDPTRWGRIIDYTAGGSPIIEMPGLYFVDFKKQAEEEREAAAAEQKAEQEQAAQLQAEQQAAQQTQQQTFLKFLATMQSGAGSGGSYPNGYGPNGAFSPNPTGTTVISSGGSPNGTGSGN